MDIIKKRPEQPISANIIKATISMAYRDKQYITCTEFRFREYNSHLKDVFAVKDDEMIEFEIKISKPDLLGDIKKKKHKKSPTVNKFYYVVPRDLVLDAIELVSKINPSYGVICFDYAYKGNLMQGIHVEKRAKLLFEKSPVKPEILYKVYRRLSFENGRHLMKIANTELENRMEFNEMDACRSIVVYKKDIKKIGHTTYGEEGKTIFVCNVKLANIEEILLREILNLFGYNITDTRDRILGENPHWEQVDIEFITDMPWDEYMNLEKN